MSIYFNFQITIPKPPTELCKIYVGGLKLQTTSENLKEYFEKWGEVLDSVVKTDPNTDR